MDAVGVAVAACSCLRWGWARVLSHILEHEDLGMMGLYLIDECCSSVSDCTHRASDVRCTCMAPGSAIGFSPWPLMCVCVAVFCSAARRLAPLAAACTPTSRTAPPAPPPPASLAPAAPACAPSASMATTRVTTATTYVAHLLPLLLLLLLLLKVLLHVG